MTHGPCSWRWLPLLWLCWAGTASAQRILASTNPHRKGTGDLRVSVQSYYSRANGSQAASMKAASVSFRHFFPKHGLFSFQVEPLANGSNFGVGENYAQWTGLPWKGRHWDFAGGDFRTSTALVEVPFTNLNLPELVLRGGKATARTDHWNYSFYGGSETLSQGNRVPFRVRVPQSALGVEAAGNLTGKVQAGFRFLHLDSSSRQVAGQSLFFPINRQFTRSTSLTLQASVRLTQALEWYTEAGLNRVAEAGSSQGRHSPFSVVFGPALHTARFSLQASYTRQGTGYLPVLGYYLGDRRGPNVEGVLSLGRLSLSGTWLQTRNDLERNPDVPDFFSRQAGGGFHLRLPANLFLSGSISRINLETRSAEAGVQLSKNRQYQATLSRPVFHHNLRATWQRMDLQFRGSGQRIQSQELEDNYTWRRFTAGAAVRWQSLLAEQRRQSLFFRTSAQMQLRHVSLYGYWEQGKDLANATLFATNITSTSVVGFSWEVPRKMTARVEVFRNNLNSVMNPESLFVLGSRGITRDTILSRSNDWSLFLRVTREFDWGEPLALDSRGLARQEAPLTGALAGFVKVRTTAGESGAADVWVTVDSGPSAKTDGNGYFQIAEVPQGARVVALDMDRLPADFNPTEQKEVSAQVRSGQLARVELEVTPLQSLNGIVSDAEGNPAPEGVVVRLMPGDQYTTTDRLGQFGFYNLPEGDYSVALLERNLPESARLMTPATLPATVRYGAPAVPVHFRYEILSPGPKPVKKVLKEQQQVAQLSPETPTKEPSPKQLKQSNPKRRVIARAIAYDRKNPPVRRKESSL